MNEFDFTGSAIGVGAITITNDEFIVLIRRASWTGECANMIDRPGGHAEPDEALQVISLYISF
jgi:8-oxo-dGTP pyrophosphatase MutT (NUDIX family)